MLTFCDHYGLLIDEFPKIVLNTTKTENMDDLIGNTGLHDSDKQTNTEYIYIMER